jgi:6-pyruvoyltetrahydropterin/6-carboxytetrahydropterin synthase
VIIAEVQAEDVIQTAGDPQEGMVLDFGFLKALLMRYVHDPLDHGFIVYEKDAALLRALGEMNDDGTLVAVDEVNRYGWKVIPFPYVPTAENIARWSFEQLAEPVHELSHGRAELVLVTVHETPNSSAGYGPHTS